MRGLEPPAYGTTNRRSNQLSYTRHVFSNFELVYFTFFEGKSLDGRPDLGTNLVDHHFCNLFTERKEHKMLGAKAANYPGQGFKCVPGGAMHENHPTCFGRRGPIAA